MTLESFEMTAVVPASAEDAYLAWISGDEHAAMTEGGPAESDARMGGRFAAWDGYITGSYMELDPNRRLLMSWRTTDFDPAAPDSRVEVLFEDLGEGQSRLTIRHSEIPEGQADGYRQGWDDYYFKPMTQYFDQKRSVASAEAAPEESPEPEESAPTETPPPPPPEALAERPAARKAPAKKRAPAKKKAAAKKKPAPAKKKTAAKKKAAPAKKKSAGKKKAAPKAAKKSARKAAPKKRPAKKPARKAGKGRRK